MASSTLPPQPSRLIGRTHDLKRVCTFLQDASVRLLTLVGPAGVGKTRLAIAVAASLADVFADGVVFVDLSPVEDPCLVSATIAKTLDVPDDGSRPIGDILKSFLKGKSILLVLDNFEQVAVAANEVGDLLARTPRLKVLVTSRTPLRLSWERQFPLPPLPLPSIADWASPDRLRACPSVSLFVERAQAVAPDFRLADQNARIVAAICARLDGLPLAIELAAARTKLLGPASILDWLNLKSGRSNLELLRGGWRDHHRRHQTLRAALDWSYQLLSSDEQTLFRRLAVFVGGFTIETVALVCPTPDCLDLLSALGDQSLLVRVVSSGSHGEMRLRMLQPIRAFALDQLEAAGELTEMRRRHAALFLVLAEQAGRESEGPTQASWVRRLQSEQDNLRAALAWSLEHDPETALRLSGHLSWFWDIHGPYGEAQTWLEAALARCPAGSTEWRAKALSGAGTMAWNRGNFTQATAFHQKSLALYRELGNRCGIALTLNNLGAQAHNLGDFDQARRRFEEGLAIARESGDMSAIARPLINLGILAIEQNQFDRARRWLEEALEVCRQIQHPFLLIHALQNLGETLFNQGELDRALELHRESLGLCRDIGAQVTLAFCLEEVGGVFAARGENTRAARVFGAAEVLRQADGTPVPPNYRAQFYEPIVATLRARLGEAFEAIWTAGRALSLEAAIAEALGEEVDGPGGGAGENDRIPSLVDSVPSAYPLPSPVPLTALQLAPSPSSSLPSSAPDLGQLTKREREVAALIAHGLSNREIAERLVIGEGTVATHVAHILSKLAFHSRAQIAASVVAQGLANSPSR